MSGYVRRTPNVRLTDTTTTPFVVRLYIREHQYVRELVLMRVGTHAAVFERTHGCLHWYVRVYLPFTLGACTCMHECMRD